MEDRRVAREQILAFRAARHSLDARRPPTALADVAAACGIQDTPPGSADVSLSARLDLDGPIATDAVASKRLALTWSVRGAPHLVPVDELPVFTLGARPDVETITKLWRQPEDSLAAIEKAMVAALRGGARTKGEVSAAVASALPDRSPFCRACDAHHPNETVFRAATLLGRIVLASTAPVQLVKAKTWLGHDITGDAVTARTELLVRYLHCYAPTTAADFATWAGISAPEARARWDAVADRLVPVKALKRAFVLEEDLDALTSAELPKGVRLLPNKDAYLQARDRDVLVPDAAQRKAVFTVLGGPGMLLVDGAPAGTWRASAKGRRDEINVTATADLSTRARAALEEEAARLAAARGRDEVAVTVS